MATRYRKNILKIKFPKGTSIINKIKYIEENIPNAEIQARQLAESYGIRYMGGHEALQETYYNPYLKVYTKLDKTTIYHARQKTLALLTGQYSYKRQKEYGKNYVEKLENVAPELSSRLKKILYTSNRERVLKELPSLSRFYYQYKSGKTRKKRKYNLNSELELKRLTQIINDTEEIIKRYEKM